MYTIHRFNVVNYYKYIIKVRGIKFLWGLTDSYYPRCFALAWCLHKSSEIVICKIGRWQLRELHEVGHVVGFEHVYKIGWVMFPWGLLRGHKGEDEINELL
jgi:hypothetical protein